MHIATSKPFRLVKHSALRLLSAMCLLFLLTYLNIVSSGKYGPEGIVPKGTGNVKGKKCYGDKDCEVDDKYCFGECTEENKYAVACESHGKGTGYPRKNAAVALLKQLATAAFFMGQPVGVR